MAARTPARFLAPIALVAFAFALYTVVQHARDDGTGSSSSTGTPAQTTPSKSSSAKKSAKQSAKQHAKHFHRVRAGETPSSIALKYGVTVKTLQQLNPSMDPNALTVGERLRLRK
jgi:LysM repeat protein